MTVTGEEERVKIVLAPDKFAGTLTAAEAATAMAAGWRAVRPDDEIVILPMADGGEGTVAVVAQGRPDAERREHEVADARGRAVIAPWLLLPDGTAVIESASACGIAGVPVGDRDPLRLTSYGVGQLVRAAADAGARRIVVGLGGSATVDGGAGAALALGHRLLRADGNGVKVGPAWLSELHTVKPASDGDAFADVDIVAAVDVDNPLLGDRGAAPVFAPQKGADDERVRLLTAALTQWADVVERDVPGGPWRDLPGAGAAGGLGFALAAFAGAQLTPGAQIIGELLGLDRVLGGADLVVTGEGSLDAQTGAGKAPEYVRRRARAAGAAVAVVAGRIVGDTAAAFDQAVALGADGERRAAELVTERTAELSRLAPAAVRGRAGTRG